MTNAERYRGFEIISNSDTGSWNIQRYTEQPDHSLRVEGLASCPTQDAAREWIDNYHFHKSIMEKINAPSQNEA